MSSPTIASYFSPEFIEGYDSTCNFFDGRLVKYGNVNSGAKLASTVNYDAKSPFQCAQYAHKLLLHWKENRHKEDKNDVDAHDTNTDKNGFEESMVDDHNRLRGIAEAVTGSPNGPLPDAWWTFSVDPIDGAYSSMCEVSFKCVNTRVISERPTGQISGQLGLAYDGYNGMCTIPFRTDTCLKSKMDNLPVDECFGVNMDLETGLFCRNVFNQLPASSSGISRQEEIERMCTRYGTLKACECYNRETDDAFKKWEQYISGGVPDACWYRPCKFEGNDRLVTDEMIEARKSCSATFCQNLIQVVGNDSTAIEDLQATVNCSSDDLVPPSGGGSGSGSGGDGVVVGGDGQMSANDNVKDADFLGIVKTMGLSDNPGGLLVFMVYAFVLLVLLVIGGVAYYLIK